MEDKKIIENKENIFDQLFNKKITFAVCVNDVLFGSIVGKDYFIIALLEDVNNEKVRITGFSKSDTFKDCGEFTLSDKELEGFDEDKFIKLKHTEDGRVYEII